MATFQKLTDVAVAEVVSEQANVFIEDGGELKRVAKSQVGGAGSLADLKDVVYFHVTLPEMDFGPMPLDNSGVAPADAAPPEVVVTCNKTFDEVLSLILNHELKMVVAVVWDINSWNQMQVLVHDWWLADDDDDTVFDSTAEYILFYGAIESNNYDHRYDKATLFMSRNGDIGAFMGGGEE